MIGRTYYIKVTMGTFSPQHYTPKPVPTVMVSFYDKPQRGHRHHRVKRMIYFFFAQGNILGNRVEGNLGPWVVQGQGEVFFVKRQVNFVYNVRYIYVNILQIATGQNFDVGLIKRLRYCREKYSVELKNCKAFFLLKKTNDASRSGRSGRQRQTSTD